MYSLPFLTIAMLAVVPEVEGSPLTVRGQLSVSNIHYRQIEFTHTFFTIAMLAVVPEMDGSPVKVRGQLSVSINNIHFKQNLHMYTTHTCKLVSNNI
jgi:hypothetical protein